MCRGQWPAEFVEQLFEECEDEEVISLQYGCSCNEDPYVDFLSPNMLQGLSESQKNSLRETIEYIEWYYGDETQRLLVVFQMCPEHPLSIDPEESSADCQYEVMKTLLEWVLDHVAHDTIPTSHSTFLLFFRPFNYDHFGPEPDLLDALSDP